MDKYYLSKLCIPIFFITLNAIAAPSDDVGRRLQIHRQQEDMLTRPEVLDVEEGVVAPIEKPLTDSSDISVMVNRFQFEGNFTLFKSEVFDQELSEYIGRELTLNQLQEAANRITSLYRRHGYLLARAILNPQDVSTGTIILKIVEGELDTDDGGVKINDPEHSLRLDIKAARKYLITAMPPGAVVSESRVERGVLLLSKLPGINASGNLEPGKSPGSARLVVDMHEGNVFNPFVGLNNYGGRLTGEWQTIVGAKINNLNGYGNQISLYGSHSLGSGSNDYLSVGYSHPVGYQGLQVGAAYQHLNYRVGKEFSGLDLTGTAENWSVDADYPIILARKTRLSISSSLEWKNIMSEALGSQLSDQRIKKAVFGLSANHADNLMGGGVTSVNLDLHAGNVDLSGSSRELAKDQSIIGPHRDGGYEKVTFDLRRNQSGAHKYHFVGTLRGQFSDKNLVSAEKLQLGGPFGVRAYPVGEASGDDGALINLEAHYALGYDSRVGNIQLVAFYDWGWIRQNHDASNLIMGDPNSYNLKGYGFGINAGKPEQVDFNLSWARRIGNNPVADVHGNDSDGSHKLGRIWASLRVFF